MSRLARILFLAVMTLSVTAPAASGVPTKKLGDTLGALWTTVLETPSAQNSYGSGGQAFACWHLGGKVAPLAPSGVEACTVKPGTKIFVAASTWECSTLPGDHPGFGTTEGELRACARQNDAQVAPIVTVDGKAVPVNEVETRPLKIVLPADNIFGPALPAGTKGLSVAHGWVTLLHPLAPGKHTIVIDKGGPPITTTITVKPRSHYGGSGKRGSAKAPERQWAAYKDVARTGVNAAAPKPPGSGLAEKAVSCRTTIGC